MHCYVCRKVHVLHVRNEQLRSFAPPWYDVTMWFCSPRASKRYDAWCVRLRNDRVTRLRKLEIPMLCMGLFVFRELALATYGNTCEIAVVLGKTFLFRLIVQQHCSSFDRARRGASFDVKIFTPYRGNFRENSRETKFKFGFLAIFKVLARRICELCDLEGCSWYQTVRLDEQIQKMYGLLGRLCKVGKFSRHDC